MISKSSRRMCIHTVLYHGRARAPVRLHPSPADFCEKYSVPLFISPYSCCLWSQYTCPAYKFECLNFLLMRSPLDSVSRFSRAGRRGQTECSTALQ